MLVENVTAVTLKCREFGVRPFDLAPGEVKDIPDNVAALWLAMTEKPVVLVGKTEDVIEDEDIEDGYGENVDDGDVVDENSDEDDIISEDVIDDVQEQDAVPRKRNRR